MCDDKKNNFADHLKSLMPGALSFVDGEVFNRLFDAIKALIKERKSPDEIFNDLKKNLEFKKILERLGRFEFKKLIGGVASLSLLYKTYTNSKKTTSN